MKVKIIASAVALTTIFSVAYPIASKAMGTKELEESEIQVETSYNNEEETKEEVEKEVGQEIIESNDEELTNNSNEDFSEKEIIEEENLSKEENEKVQEDKVNSSASELVEGWNNVYGKMRYFKIGKDGVLESTLNSYVDGYYLDYEGIRSNSAATEKVTNLSDAIDLIKIHNQDYFNNSALDYFTLDENGGYKVESIRDEFGISNIDMIDEPAYMVNFIDKNTLNIEFRYAVGCYTGKVYFGAYGFPKAYEVEYDLARGEYSNTSTYIPE